MGPRTLHDEAAEEAGNRAIKCTDGHRDDDGIGGNRVPLADLGQADGEEAVEREREHHTRHHRDEREVDGELS